MRGKAALGFVADRCRTLVSITTESFHRVIERVKRIPICLQWEKRWFHLFSVVYDPIPMILAGNEDMHKSLDDFEFGQDLTTDCRVSCP